MLGCLGGEGDLNGGTRGIDDVGGGSSIGEGECDISGGGFEEIGGGLSGTRGGSGETKSPKSSNVTCWVACRGWAIAGVENEANAEFKDTEGVEIVVGEV